MRGFRLAAVLAITIVAHPWAAAAQSGIAVPDGVIAVVGEGRVSVLPDMATVRLGVVARGDVPGTAVRDMNVAMAAVLAAMSGAGLEARDIQTGVMSLRPVYAEPERPGGDPGIVAYEAETGVTVTVSDLDRLGGVLDAAVAQGANRLDGIGFGLSDAAPSEDAALRAAVSDALRKAGVIARAAGQTPGPVVAITEGRAGSPLPMMREAAAADFGGAIAAGALEVTATVTLQMALRSH